MINLKTALLLTTMVLGAGSVVYAAAPDDDSKPEAKARKEITSKLRIIDNTTGKGPAKANDEAAHANPWKNAQAMERKSHTRLRRAEVALMLAKERLEKILAAEKRRDAQRADDDARRSTRLQTLEKLAAVYGKMKVQKAGQVLDAFDPDPASDVLALMPAKRAAKIVAAMKPNRAAALLQRWTTQENN